MSSTKTIHRDSQAKGFIAGIFGSKWDERDGTVVPDDDSVGLGNEAVKLNATVLYADLAVSWVATSPRIVPRLTVYRLRNLSTGSTKPGCNIRLHFPSDTRLRAHPYGVPALELSGEI